MKATWLSLMAVPLILLGPLACKTPLLERPWLEITTRHFEIVTPLDEDDAKALAADLEVFRAFLEFVTKAHAPRPAVPTRIFAFSDPSALEPFSQNDQTPGYFLATQRANYLVMIFNPDTRSLSFLSDRRSCPNAVTFHEYVHFVLHNGSEVTHPRWYDEGYAELLSCTQIDDEFVTFAHVPEGRRIDIAALRTFLQIHPDGGGLVALPGATIRWFGVDELIRETLENTPPEEWATFYAQSWALVHLLYLGLPQEGVPISKRMARYLEMVSSGITPGDAIQSSFGYSEVALDAHLRRYVAGGKFVYGGIARSKLAASGVESMRRLTAAEVANLLGELSLAIGKAESAEAIYAQAREYAPTDVTLARGLANTLAAQQRWRDAEPLYRQVISVSPDDAFGHLDFANYLSALALNASEDTDIRARSIEMAMREYEAALRLDEAMPEAHARYGALLLVSERTELAIEHLEAAHRILPSDSSIQLLLAGSYVSAGRSREALDLLKRVIAWSHSDELRAAAREQIQLIGQFTRPE